MFDTRFFHMSPKEAEHTDPAQRLALMTTYEALEMAGFVPDRTPSSQRDRVGVFFGTTSDDWREVNSGQNIGTYFIPGGNRAFVPGRITCVSLPLCSSHNSWLQFLFPFLGSQYQCRHCMLFQLCGSSRSMPVLVAGWMRHCNSRWHQHSDQSR